MIKKILETIIGDLEHLKTLLEEYNRGERPLSDAWDYINARIDVYSEPERLGTDEEEVLKGLRDIVELAESSIERMKRDIKRKREGKPFKPMDWFYFFAWYGDCMEARGQLAVAEKLMPSEEVKKLWERAAEAHSKACELRAVILGLKESYAEE